jgi:hypothetical protein
MRSLIPNHLALPLVLIVTLTGCRTGPDEQIGVVGAGDLAGTYTGVLQGVSVDNLDDSEDPDLRVIVDLDLLHALRVEATGALKLRIASDIIPPLRAVVLGVGPVAVNVEFVEFEGFAPADPDPAIEALKVKQIVFVRYQDDWVLVLQIARVGVEAEDSPVYVYQYVAYPAGVAEAMSEEAAILYVNAILRLASAAQRL